MLELLKLHARTKKNLIQEIKQKPHKEPSMFELLRLHARAEKSEKRLTRKGGMRNPVHNLSRDMKKEEREGNAENSTNEIKERAERVRMINRLEREQEAGRK